MIGLPGRPSSTTSGLFRQTSYVHGPRLLSLRAPARHPAIPEKRDPGRDLLAPANHYVASPLHGMARQRPSLRLEMWPPSSSQHHTWLARPATGEITMFDQ